jgi:hypothetical protein
MVRTKEQARVYGAAYQASMQGKAASARYRASAKGRAAIARGNARRRLLHPERNAASLAVYRAREAGLLTRLPCEVCGKFQTVAHHPDYSKPLSVQWLCRKCHLEVHCAKEEKCL